MNTIATVGADASVLVLDLHVRITNRLASIGIYRVGDLCQQRASDLLRVPGLAAVSLREVEAALQRIGRSLRAEDAQ